MMKGLFKQIENDIISRIKKIEELEKICGSKSSKQKQRVRANELSNLLGDLRKKYVSNSDGES